MGSKLEKYRNALLSLREAILKEEAGRSPQAVRDPREPLDEDEQPLTEMLQVIDSNRNSVRAGELARIERALRKLEETPEEFGLCIECEEEIAERRLAARPYVERCVDCQASRDAPRGGGRRHLTDWAQ